jgi:hypothetical protein
MRACGTRADVAIEIDVEIPVELASKRRVTPVPRRGTPSTPARCTLSLGR